MEKFTTCFARLLPMLVSMVLLAGCSVPANRAAETKTYIECSALQLSVISESAADIKYSYVHHDADRQITWLLCEPELLGMDKPELLGVDNEGNVKGRAVLSGCSTVNAYYYDAGKECLLVTSTPDTSSLPISIFLDVSALKEVMKRTTLYCYSMDGSVLWSVPFDHSIWGVISKYGESYYLVDAPSDAWTKIFRISEEGVLEKVLAPDLIVQMMMGNSEKGLLTLAYEERVPTGGANDERFNDWLETGALFTVYEDSTYKKEADVERWSFPFILDKNETACFILFGDDIVPDGVMVEPYGKGCAIYSVSSAGDAQLLTELMPILSSIDAPDCFAVLTGAQRIGSHYFIFGQYQGQDNKISKQFVLALDADFRVVEAYSFYLGTDRTIVSLTADSQEIRFCVTNEGESIEMMGVAVELWMIRRED